MSEFKKKIKILLSTCSHWMDISKICLCSVFMWLSESYNHGFFFNGNLRGILRGVNKAQGFSSRNYIFIAGFHIFRTLK